MVIYTPTWTAQFTWAALLALFVTFIFAYGIGANDCSNAWGTAIGSGTIKHWQAYLLAALFNTLGAILLGYQASDTIRNGIFDLNVYDVFSVYNQTTDSYDQVRECGNKTVPDRSGAVNAAPIVSTNVSNNYANCTEYTSVDYLVGELGVLTAAAIWMVACSVARFVGASLGFTLVARGMIGIRWKRVIDVGLSWLLSPLISGLITTFFYLIIKRCVMRSSDPYEAALNTVPLFLWFTVFTYIFSLLYRGSAYLSMDDIPFSVALFSSIAAGGLIAVVFLFLLRCCATRPDSTAKVASDRQIKKESVVEGIANKASPAAGSSGGYGANTGVRFNDDSVQFPDVIESQVGEDPSANKVFAAMHLVSACFLSFSLGYNDSANAVGPLIGIWITYKLGWAQADASERSDVQLILLFGALSTISGMCTLGHRVMRTVGKDFTQISAASGFAVELSAALTVLMASKIGFPVSTTHCVVGSVIIVGCIKNGVDGVCWKTVRKTVIAWLLTLPVTCVIAGTVSYLLLHFVVRSV